ncbi:hypothetical protein DY000_02049277 [Brassica cretica]|uniref:Uncharacterized protein n=1 Tax=Brassica cretica TaxID=69181 RepID=A0ABQ7EU50_BRACR|nr:hypothetical protein DY000_02049277 [Brassica cretica]
MACSIQLPRSASWTACSIQLARWTACSIQLARLASWTVRSVQIAPSASWTMVVSLFGICLSEARKDISSELSDIDSVVTDFDPNNAFLCFERFFRSETDLKDFSWKSSQKSFNTWCNRRLPEGFHYMVLIFHSFKDFSDRDRLRRLLGNSSQKSSIINALEDFHFLEIFWQSLLPCQVESKLASVEE